MRTLSPRWLFPIVKDASGQRQGNGGSLVDEGRGLGEPADLAAGELNLQPIAAGEKEAGLDAPVQRRVVSRRIGRAVAFAQDDIVLGDDDQRVQAVADALI